MSVSSGEVLREVPGYDVCFGCERQTDVALLIPVINEGDRILSLLSKIQAEGCDTLVDVMIVDGGSTDGSLEHDRLRRLGVRALLRKTGPGKLSAQLRCGYAYVLDKGYSGVVTIDGNDKDDPAAIKRMLAELSKGVDFVQASRFLPGGEAVNTPKSRDFAIRWIHAPLLSLSSGFSWTDTTQGFRAYSRALLADSRMALFRDVFSAYELLAYVSYRAPRLGFRCKEIPSVRRYPADGSIPTKISSVRGNWLVLKTLFNACLGRYNP